MILFTLYLLVLAAYLTKLISALDTEELEVMDGYGKNEAVGMVRTPRK